jgi:hypothetical protein
MTCCGLIIGTLVLGGQGVGAQQRSTGQTLGGSQWRFHEGDGLQYATPEYDDSSWGRIRVGSSWHSQGHRGYFGFGWYRTTFVPVDAVRGGPLVRLRIDQGNSDTWSYLNGRLLGSTFRGEHVADIPAAWLEPGANSLAVRVFCGGYPAVVAYEGCGLTGSVTLEASSTANDGVPVAVTTDRLGNITEPGDPIALRTRVINSSGGPLDLEVRFRVRPLDQAGPSMKEARFADLPPGRAVTLTAHFAAAVRGRYQLDVTVRDGGQSIGSGSVVFGVADPPGPPDQRFGTNSLAGDDIAAATGADVPIHLDLAARAGATWVREHLIPWAYVEQEPGLRNWGYFDAVAKEARARGLSVLWNVHLVPYWSLNLPRPSPAGTLLAGLQHPPLPNHYQDWARFFGDAAARYPGSHWEIGNEPDGDQPQYVSGKYGLDDHLAYLDLLKRSYGAIKEADPSATVVLAGMQRPEEKAIRETGRRETFFGRLMRAGAAGYFEVMNFHAYGEPLGGRIPERTAEVLDLMRRYGIADRPLWNTETNSIPPDPGTSRIAAVRDVVESLAWGVDRAFFFYTIDYPDEAPGFPWGLFDPSAQPRPAFFTFLTMTRLLGGLFTIDPVTVQGVRGYRFTDGSRTAIVLWSDEGAQLQVPPGSRAYDDYGNLITESRVAVGPTAVYLISGQPMG